ncbi:hypothetical protein PIB30_087909, partial [Stylosanthes scabra]|nr:hypothetical protein [Stylosanthes scabra]
LDEWSYHKVKSFCCAFVKNLQTVNNLRPSLLRASLIKEWTPPYGNRIKVNCDASINPTYQRAGFDCVVVRNALGN